MNDPRRGVPSASKMERIANCPFSHKAEQLVPPLPSGKDAEVGTLGHSVLSDDLSADEVPTSVAETAEMCEMQTDRLLADWLQEGDYETYKEVRYGLTSLGKVLEVTPESKATFVFTGQEDRLYVQGNRGLLVDFKTLFGHHPNALENAQLASLAAMIGPKHCLTSLRVAIVQPWRGKPTVCDYSQDDLLSAWHWLLNVLDAEARATPADRKAGPWCSKCNAAAHCEVLRNFNHQQLEALNPMTIAGADGETQAKALYARSMELPAETHAALLRGLPMVKRMVAAIEASAKQRAAEDPEFQRFYVLRDKKGKRSISDVARVWSACSSKGVSAEAFTAECSIGLGAVKDLLKAATGAKGKALDALHLDVLNGAVETGKGSQELVPVNLIEG